MADLLDAAHHAADTASGARGVRGVRVVPGDDPTGAVVGVLAAQAAGSTPLVAPPALDPAARDRLVTAAADVTVRATEPLLAVVTSGTTGAPRGIVRTTASWHESFAAFDTLLGPDTAGDSTGWVPGAPASTLTLFGLWHALATGRAVVAPGPWRAAAVASGALTDVVQCVPAVLADVLDAREAGHLPRLTRAVVAGAAVPDALRERAARAGVHVVEYYGAAELSFVAADLDGEGLRAFPGAEVAAREGRLVVRSRYLAAGYLPADATGSLHVDPDGWAGVGDRGAITEQGRVVVLGRGDAVLSVGGHLIALDDVERCLTAVPGVREVVCVPEADARLGARVLAVVRPEPGPPVDREVLVRALRAAARRQLPSPARPVRYVLRHDLPRTPGGKPARARLAADLGVGDRTLTS